MTKQWMLIALLGAALVAGCADRSAEHTDTLTDDEGETVTALEPAPEQAASPAQDTPAARVPAATPSRPAAPQAAAPPAQPTPVYQALTLPVSTILPLELTTALSSESSTVETPVRARLRQAVMVDDVVVLPAGTVLIGDVIEAERSGRVQGRARLAFTFHTVEVEGRRESLRTNPITYEAEGTVGEDAATVGAGAVGGAIIGGILGGGSGAARGAAIGGAAGTGVVLATRGREVELEAGTNVAATLAQPFEIQVRVP